PPAHGFRADIYRGELEHAISKAAVPSAVRPREEEREDLIAQPAVEPRRQQRMYRHHKGYKGVDAEYEPEERRGEGPHEFEVDFADQRPGVGCRGQRTEDCESL